MSTFIEPLRLVIFLTRRGTVEWVTFLPSLRLGFAKRTTHTCNDSVEE